MDFAHSCSQVGMDCELHRLRAAKCIQCVCMGVVLGGRPQTQGAESISAHHPSGYHCYLRPELTKRDNWAPA